MKVELQYIIFVVDIRGLIWGENLVGSLGFGSYYKSYLWREKKNYSLIVGKFIGIIKIFYVYIFLIILF